MDAALSCLADDDTIVERVDAAADGWVAFAGSDDHDLLGERGGPFTVRLSRLLRTHDDDLSTADLAAMIDDGSGLATLLPPFAAAHRDVAGGAVTVAGDWLGFRQLYWWRGDGAAALSTSARALAVLAGGGFDRVGLGAQALIGWQVGDRTIFAGVRAVPPATIATLAGGSLQLRQYAEPLAQDGPAPALDDAVEEMANILARWQASYLEAHPDIVLQLTGGHDSRILLGAIPEKLRVGLRALTLGEENSPDVVIAAKLSERYGMRHQVYRFHEHESPSPVEAHVRSLAAARALECLASPLALAPLLLAEAHLEQGYRLSGLGGEVARGFYYAGQPAGAQTSQRLVERLARWRLFSNEAVEAAALERTFLDEAREYTLATLNDLFAPGDWLRATDQFYLYHRMHRWAAVHGSVAAVRRHTVNPMFDRRFIELALAVAPAAKRDSLLLGRLMSRLDQELARIPLDSGLVPARLGHRSVATRLAVGTATARKAAGKVRQRLTHAGKPQLGAARMSELVLAYWRAQPSACRALYDLPVLDRKWLDGLLAGTQSGAATTVAFLVNLLAAIQPPAD
ncbi:asparagine synthase-related protein [Micromonospora rhizosphaerae]|uniref:asparagine synthase-related protein n=1 Tax=Micromonospora rhizosphaerae TaxID=568872 RepID=UPI00159F2D63|nr:asparagine synthase-related protein [Micromonospora rhizosphaerae]